MNRRVKTAIIFLLFGSFLFFYFLTDKAHQQPYPVIGLDPLHIEMLEDHNDALDQWISKGIRHAPLMIIDAHDDMKRIAPKDMEDIATVYRGRGAGSVRSAHFRDYPVINGNFVYAAAKLGIIDRVYWIAPSSYQLFSDDGSRLISLLAMYGFHDSDISTFSVKDGCFSGSVDGIPLLICQPERLPDLDEPLLLTIDMDFFPEMNNACGYKFTNSIRQTLGALYSKGYSIRDTTIAFSISGSFVSAAHRWTGDLVADSLRTPTLLSKSELPERYSILQRLDLLLLMERYEEALNYVSPLLKRGGNDPALLMYAARASQELDEVEKAFHYAEDACLAEKSYCYGLAEIGNVVLDKYGLRSAERFFARAYDLNPGMDHDQFRYAMALKKAGRHDEAIKYFNVFRKIYGPFPVDFYLAETYLLKGDETSALSYYDSGRAALVMNPHVIAGFGDMSVIERGARFCEKKGYVEYASELRSAAKLNRIDLAYRNTH